MSNMPHQYEQLEKLRSGELKQGDASIYTILLDLVDDADIIEVFSILHNVATDLKQREILECEFEKSKEWQW